MELFDRDLFGPTTERYPRTPGHKTGGTSHEAAIQIAPHAKTLCAHALREFQVAGERGLSADQVAAKLGASVLAVRPRISELKRAGLIVPTERRTRNDSGMSARVWRVSQEGVRQ